MIGKGQRSEVRSPKTDVRGHPCLTAQGDQET